jgi:uncharacterized protein (DUF697 family)/tellurite resistance protein
MHAKEIESVGALCVLAAMADGSMADGERIQVRAVFEGLGDGDEAKALASACRRAMLGQTNVEREARNLESIELRRYAFEMAVAVCDADGRLGDAERAFVDRLRRTLGLDAAESAALVAEADGLADIVPAAPLAVPPPPPPPARSDATAEIDSSILKHAVLAGALELLPQGLATMAIVPLQMKLVYGVGKSYGVTLDRGHVKELIATVGVGMTSQVVENVARDLLGGLAKKFLGKKAGKLVGTATGAAMSFATTYALGQVAKQYYSGGRRLSAVDLRAIFTREVERAKGLYGQHRPQIEETARTVDTQSLLATLRGV